MSVGWLPTPPDPHQDRATKLEHSACQAALRVIGVPLWRVNNLAGLDSPMSRLTFTHLVQYTNFPAHPSVTETALDDVGKLLLKFEKTKLYAAWLSVWDDRPDTKPGQRSLVIHGADTGLAIVYDWARPDRPHLFVGHQADLGLTIEPFSSWCKGLNWSSDSFDER